MKLFSSLNFYKKGMTIIEILVAVGILGLIMVSIGSFQTDIFNYNKFSEDSLSGIQDARSILRVMVKELRSTSPSSDATNTMTFFVDTDADGLKEKIRYFIENKTLKRGSIKPSGNPLTYNNVNEKFSTLAYNIVSATSTALFEFFDDNYAGTSTPLIYPISVTDIQLVRINLLIDADPIKLPELKTYTSQVSLRNLKDNL